ncbi:MAG TPA: hypothetical protein VFK02_28205 [Kofleriaceae bacterium]|nr:hypothetical protein [Kofleriaceae bacterium]
MGKLLVLAALLGCSSGTARSHDAPPRPPPDPPGAPRETDAPRPPAAQASPSAPVATPTAPAAPARPPATEITPVDLAGPYPSLAASCKAAPPCGFTDMDARGNESKPATRPRCDAVLDPSNDIVGHVPDAFSKTGAATAMTHRRGDTEIRFGGVICAVPKGLRREHSMYYVFVHRPDGWWRTTTAMFEYDYNDKYCGGAMYIKWNDKPTRTIAGIAAEASCLACTKQGQSSSITELMLRVEVSGDRPAVFPLLPVGYRSRLEKLDDSSDLTGAECKPSRSAMSLTETWPADDEVVLDGSVGPTVSASEGMTLDRFVGDGTIRPGRYRFTR